MAAPMLDLSLDLARSTSKRALVLSLPTMPPSPSIGSATSAVGRAAGSILTLSLAMDELNGFAYIQTDSGVFKVGYCITMHPHLHLHHFIFLAGSLN
jgi:hypothetical protein